MCLLRTPLLFRETASPPTALAVQVLDELVDTNEVSKDRADEAKKIYQNLHTTALKAMASEKQRLDEAKVLKKRLEDENEAKHSPPAKGEESDLQSALLVRWPSEKASVVKYHDHLHYNMKGMNRPFPHRVNRAKPLNVTTYW